MPGLRNAKTRPVPQGAGRVSFVKRVLFFKEFGGGDVQDLGDLEQHVERGRMDAVAVVGFQLTEKTPTASDLIGQLLLSPALSLSIIGDPRFESGRYDTGFMEGR